MLHVDAFPIYDNICNIIQSPQHLYLLTGLSKQSWFFQPLIKLYRSRIWTWMSKTWASTIQPNPQTSWPFYLLAGSVL